MKKLEGKAFEMKKILSIFIISFSMFAQVGPIRYHIENLTINDLNKLHKIVENRSAYQHYLTKIKEHQESPDTEKIRHLVMTPDNDFCLTYDRKYYFLYQWEYEENGIIVLSKTRHHLAIYLVNKERDDLRESIRRVNMLYNILIRYSKTSLSPTISLNLDIKRNFTPLSEYIEYPTSKIFSKLESTEAETEKKLINLQGRLPMCDQLLYHLNLMKKEISTKFNKAENSDYSEIVE